MFELLKKDDSLDSVDKILGGIFGIIAIVAAIVEMALGGFTIDSIVAAIKDISGTAVVVVLLIAFIRRLPKAAENVKESIEVEMEKVENSYSPLIKKVEIKDTDNDVKKNKLDKIIRYEIANDIDALFGKNSSYIRFFDIEMKADKPNKIKFAIRKSFFGDTPEHPFNPENIAKNLTGYMEKNHQESIFKYAPDEYGGFVVVSFKHLIETDKDIEELISIIDDMLFVYVAENKK